MTFIKITNNSNAFLRALTKGIDASLVKEWLQRYPNVIHAKDVFGVNALCHARDADVAKALLSVKEALLDEMSISLLELPIVSACRNGFVDIVKLILSKRPKQIHFKGSCGQTPLSAAIACNSFTTVQLLYEMDNSTIDYRSRFGYNAMHVAIGNGEMAQWVYELRPHFLSAKSEQGETPIHIACARGDLAMVKWIFDINPETIKERCKRGRTTLHRAAWSGNYKLMEWLLHKRPALYHMTTNDGETPLQMARREVRHTGTEPQWFRVPLSQSITILESFGRLFATTEEDFYDALVVCDKEKPLGYSCLYQMVRHRVYLLGPKWEKDSTTAELEEE